MYVFLIGGARSGKSALAVKLAHRSEAEVTVFVTGTPSDPEMAERIRRHQAERPVTWKVIEAPIDLGEAIADVETDSFLLFDCLTLWVSNLMAAGSDEPEIRRSCAGMYRPPSQTGRRWSRRLQRGRIGHRPDECPRQDLPGHPRPGQRHLRRSSRALGPGGGRTHPGPWRYV